MDRETLAARIDHTVLGPTTTRADVLSVVDDAEAHGMNVCIPPCYVADARDHASADRTIATVIGFPHGTQATSVKVAAAERAHADGADELDLVIPIGRLKGGDHEAVTAEIAAVNDATPLPVKVIIETPVLTDAEKRAACEAAADADAAMVKTATGFTDGGATVPDVSLMSEYLPVKASGGVGTYADAAAMFDAGAVRIGASSGVDIVASFAE
ncbi:deoxyribose-phosphate aldolase [Halobacterium salinarum]|uniref:deoxyribose-phosphate aldolase n=1 Tax=Halobacterium TaxID=2239 RepID=UPI00196683ED|nr:MULTISPECIES: deoxyribose-phosphate aldolase [Halobacterium]MCF2239820.1 deoxyribose-phosphate aldolase [Halobacterium salinarum]MDL0139298.1 deoxyribose-phosphate aldolase [Halobacterium salinarum]QRY22121.1 deoxyribose-phosphate aldolase [Halobacterium sp. GSL-19]WJK63502.1 deoxyribose-phosphate aldolase [Halobacterium salinarum]